MMLKLVLLLQLISHDLSSGIRVTNSSKLPTILRRLNRTSSRSDFDNGNNSLMLSAGRNVLSSFHFQCIFSRTNRYSKFGASSTNDFRSATLQFDTFVSS